MLQVFQTSMDKQLSNVCEKLETIDSRMVVLEAWEKNIEEEMKSGASCSSSNNSTPASGRKRKRVTPLALQSKIRKLNDSFDEDKQLKPHEGINTAANKQAVKEIIKSVGTEQYSEEQIRKACQTYRKTIAAREKAIGTPVKKKKRVRSRKQRCYERRGKEVTGPKETKRWSEVTPSMMSDEEEQGDTYIRHPPLYRSSLLAKFIETLDSRCDKRNSAMSHPRKKRVLGTSIDVPIPSEAKKWMIKPGMAKDQDQTMTSDEQNSQTPDLPQPQEGSLPEMDILSQNDINRDSDTENEETDELFSE